LSGALLSSVLSAQVSSALQRPYALAIIRDVGAAISHAHARGVVHGDLNPGNIFITDNGEVRVLDFGASHQLHRGPWISEFDNQRLIAVATPGFASCQVLEGEAADARDDVYALGCVAYLLLTGDNPFKDNTALKARSLSQSPSRPRGVTSRQWHALRAALNFDRERRPSDVHAWLGRLGLRMAAPHLPGLHSVWSVRQPRHRSGGRWPIAAAVAAVLGACGFWAATNPDDLEGMRAHVSESMSTAFAQIAQFVGGVTAPLRDQDPGLDRRADSPTEAPARSSEPAPATRNAPQAAAQAAAKPAAAAPAEVHAAPATVPRTPITAPRGAVAPPLAVNTAQAHIELAADNFEVMPTESTANIMVKRSRNLHGDVSFSWWTESGTAKPGRDFVPVRTRVAQIDNGQSWVNLTIPVVVDPARRQSRSFYVVIDQAGDSAALGQRTLAMVTLTGSDPDPDSAAGQ
jgi:hypothetical protein